MSLACPECGAAAPRGVVAGKPYACPGCRNPVLPADLPLPAPAPATAPAPAPEARASRAPLAILVFVVLAAAYLGAYELLTAQAKRDRETLLRLHGPEITTFPAPREAADPEDTTKYRAQVAARDRWHDRQRYEALGRRIDGMFVGLLAAFAFQTALTAWVAVRSWRRSTSKAAA
ncbi:MAG TPA: hypothetical protein VND21_03410 [Planctomycetota bacterium]|nr:hypothetical protein [Planctomycetota bacterium]